MTEVRYHLYVAALTDETAAAALSERFSLVTSSHVMIYRENPEIPKDFKEMTEDNVHLLPPESLKWLKSMNNTIIQEFINMRMEEHERANQQFLEDFQRELEAEKAKLLHERGDGE